MRRPGDGDQRWDVRSGSDEKRQHTGPLERGGDPGLNEMPSDTPANNQQIDPALVAAIAREVIARLKSTSKTNQTAASIHDRVITAGTIERLSGTPTQVFIAPGAIVTPAARDAARQRGIAIQTGIQPSRRDVPRDEKIQLVLHQGYQRRDDQSQRVRLVARSRR